MVFNGLMRQFVQLYQQQIAETINFMYDTCNYNIKRNSHHREEKKCLVEIS